MVYSLFISVLSFLYYIILLSSIKGSLFIHLWLFIAIFFFVLHLISKVKKNNTKRIPLSMLVYSHTIAFVGILIFFIGVNIIFYSAKNEDVKEAKYLIVISNKLDSIDRIDETLKNKLDDAVTYLNENKETKVILSGGLIKQEDFRTKSITQARLMLEYLLEQGIDIERIFLEEKGKSVRENVINSLELQERKSREEKGKLNIKNINLSYIKAEDKPETVLLLTSDYNSFRVLLILSKIDRKEVYIKSSKSEKVGLINMYLREIFIIIKEKFMGVI